MDMPIILYDNVRANILDEDQRVFIITTKLAMIIAGINDARLSDIVIRCIS